MILVRTLTVLFLLTSPMYWFFGVGTLGFQILKFSLLIFLFCFSLYTTYKIKINININIILLVLGMIISVLIADLLNGIEDFYKGIYPIFYYLVLLLIFNCIFHCFSDFEIYKIIKYVNILFFILITIIIINHTFALNISAPGSDSDISITGFTFLRTGWSGSISLFIGATIYFAILMGRRINNFELLYLISVLYVQYISGGRGGALASLIILTYYLLFIEYGKRRVIIASSLIILTVYIVSSEAFISHLRLDRIDDTVYGGITAGRTLQYIEGAKYFLNNTLMPSGTNGYLAYFNSIDILYNIHNIPLNFLVQYGVWFLIIFFAFLYYGIFYEQRNKHLAIIVALMMIPGLFEPAAIFINVNTYLIWWFVFYYNIHKKYY